MTTPNWIKMRTDLRDHPKVVRMSSALKADRLRIIGGLWAVWSTFDTHSEDGTLEGYTFAALDEGIGWKGFSQALADVRWLEEVSGGLVIPEFDEHNGASAKKRAQDTKRKQAGRESDPSYAGSWTDTGQMSATEADKKQTRVRVERESINTPIPPEGVEPEGFARFWASWPQHFRKAAKDQCRRKWDAKGCEAMSDFVVAAVQRAKASPEWLKDSGQFIPAPLTWLNQGRWDAPAPVNGHAPVGLEAFR